MSRHFRQIWNRAPHRPEQLALRAVGWLLLLASLVLCIRVSGVPIGLVDWAGVLTAGVLTLACLLAYLPVAAGVLACAAPMAALLLVGLATW